MISIEQQGIDELRMMFQRVAPEMKREVLSAVAQEIYVKAQDAADLHTKTGRLVRSLKKRDINNGNAIEIYHDTQIAPHALFVHWGTQPHEIKPKDKKALRWANGGGFVFARIVHHPGYRGDPYLVRIREEVAQNFNQIAAQSWDSVIQRVG